MEIVKSTEDLKQVKHNKIIGKKFTLLNSTIRFKGENNILYVADDAVIENSGIDFNGNNAIVYLSKNKDKYKVYIAIHNNSTIYFGENNYFNNIVNFILSEEKNIIIGKDNLFSLNIYFRVADPHLIYDIKTKERTNYSRSILIGDHCWIGQNCLVFKGTQLGSGSILAGGAVNSKVIPSNEVWGGNPCKLIRRGIAWDPSCVHNWTAEETIQYKRLENENHVFKKDDKVTKFSKLDKKLTEEKNAKKRLKTIEKYLVNNDSHNRFFIEKNSKLTKLKRKIKKVFHI